MRRPRLSLLGVVLALAAALLPGAAVFAQPANCPGPPTPEQFAAMVRDADLILVGTVSRAERDPEKTDIGTAWVRPEAFLKGNPSAAEIGFGTGLPYPCSAAGTRVGDRLLLIAKTTGGGLPMPPPERIYRFTYGVARSLNRGDSSETPEAELVASVRSLTNQYAIPASSGSEGAGIDWKGTILPVGAVLAAILVVSLFLMRIWHRIDPS